MARSRSGTRGRRGPRKPQRREGGGFTPVSVAEPRERGAVVLPATITVKELAELLEVNPADVIRELIKSGIFTTINQLIDTAADRNDELLRHIADYIRSDERTHVRKGSRIIGVMTDLEAKDLEQRTRELFTECLVSLGAVNKDMDVFTVSREDIERLVGE